MNPEQEIKSHSQQKRRDMQQDGQWTKKRQEPVPADGQPLPDPAQGWLAHRPNADPKLYIAGVRSIRMSDGTSQKFYLVLVRPAEVAEMQKRVKRLAKKIKREDEAAAKKRAKVIVREFLLRTGKI